PIATNVAGIQFSEHLKRLASMADKLAVVRSIRHDQGNHGAGNHYMVTGAPPRIPVGCGAFVSFHPSLGSVTAHERGAPAGLPAFDIGREPERVRDCYGRTPFGQRALLARRLVEAGVPFITLYEGGWDHHKDIFNALAKRLPVFDQTIATLVLDLDQRGLLDSTLVIALGEFGRTPQINKDVGRD